MIEIIDKIRQLKALSKSSNIFEAATAARLADALIQKYRISEADLEKDSSNQEAPSEDSQVLYETGKIVAWKHNLACRLAEHYSCAIYNNCYFPDDKARKVSRYRLIGRQSDREICSFMFAWLSMEIDRLTKLNCKGTGHIASYSFAEGAADGVNAQMLLSKSESKKDAEQAGQTQALVKLDERLSESKSALANLHPELKKSNPSSYRKIHQQSYHNGVIAGKNIHLGKSLKDNNIKFLE